MGMKLAHWQSSRSCTYALFLSQGVEIELIFALKTAVSKIGQIFKIAILGQETWTLTKVPEVAYILPFYPMGLKIELIFSLRVAVSMMRVDFLIAIFGHGI